MCLKPWRSFALFEEGLLADGTLASEEISESEKTEKVLAEWLRCLGCTHTYKTIAESEDKQTETLSFSLPASLPSLPASLPLSQIQKQMCFIGMKY
ncbi:hypothetical protein AALO_G00267490, partial [Alosa alosa]